LFFLRAANTRKSLQQSCIQAAASALPDAGGPNISAKLVEGPCSRVRALGGCQMSAVGTTIATWYYEDPDGVLTVDVVKTMCATLHATYLAP
jgi:hypothetical protein